MLYREFDGRFIQTTHAPALGAAAADALWHLDFHKGSLKVILPDGRWHSVQLLGILDDCTRLCCHLQWYLVEDTQALGIRD